MDVYLWWKVALLATSVALARLSLYRVSPYGREGLKEAGRSAGPQNFLPGRREDRLRKPSTMVEQAELLRKHCDEAQAMLTSHEELFADGAWESARDAALEELQGLDRPSVAPHG